MPAEAAFAGLVFACAVTLHNVEEIIWLPSFADPRLPRLIRSAFGFRFAATVITLVFWGTAAAAVSGWPVEPVLAGLAAAMIVNAIMPHLALTVFLRRYHPGTATACLLVAPSATVCLLEVTAAATWDGGSTAVALLAFAGLGASVPILIAAGGGLERALTLRW